MKNAPAQQRVLQFYQSYQVEHGYSPMQTEVAEGTGLKRSTVNKLVEKLVSKGELNTMGARAVRGVYDPQFPNQFALKPVQCPHCGETLGKLL